MERFLREAVYETGAVDGGGTRARAVGRIGTLYGLQSSLSCSLIGDANRTVARPRAVDREGNCTAVCVRLGLCPSAPLSNSWYGSWMCWNTCGLCRGLIRPKNTINRPRRHRKTTLAAAVAVDERRCSCQQSLHRRVGSRSTETIAGCTNSHVVARKAHVMLPVVHAQLIYALNISALQLPMKKRLFVQHAPFHTCRLLSNVNQIHVHAQACACTCMYMYTHI